MPLMDKAFFKEYGVPIAVTGLLHLLLLGWLAADFSAGHDEPLVKRPKAIQAKLVQLKEKKAPKQQIKKPKKKPVKKKPKKKPVKKKPEVDKKKQQQLKQEKLNKQKAAKAAKVKAAKQAQEKADKERLLKQKLQQEALERERLRKEAEEEQLQREQEESFLDDFADDALLEDSSADEAAAMSYMGAIKSAIQSNWSRPPSARNGMQVVLSIKLVPTGKVMDVNVVESSGNAAFDRSAVSAVQKAESFPELRELEPHVFEKYYRSFRLLFNPEDLRL